MGTAVAVIEEIPGLVPAEAVQTRIAPFLPPGVSPERVLAAVSYAIRQTPEIAKCQPESVIDSVARIQQWGLEIGVTAHLVPFKGKCTAVADYKGLAELMIRSRAVRHVEARVVYERDRFEYSFGLDAKLEHQPSTAKERGKITHAYAVLRLPFGYSAFEVMPIEDIEEIRKRYSKQWGPDKVRDCPAWYAKKTVVRQAAKLVPKDPRFADALRVIQEEEATEFVEPVAPAIASASVEDEDRVTPAQLTAGTATEANGEQPRADRFKEITLEQARKLTVADNPKAFKGKGGDLLDSYSTEHLEQLRSWLEEKLREEHRDDFALRVEAITLILAAREAEQTKLELDAPPAPVLSGEVSGPGQIADALEPSEKAKAREAAAAVAVEDEDDRLPF